jgi:hypothetical protein
MRTRAPRRASEERIVPPQPPLPFDGADLARRLLIFLIVVPLDLAATALLAWAAQRTAYRGRWADADATALALFLLPLLWMMIAGWQMTARPRLAAMAAAPLGCAALGGLLWLTA